MLSVFSSLPARLRSMAPASRARSFSIQARAFSPRIEKAWLSARGLARAHVRHWEIEFTAEGMAPPPTPRTCQAPDRVLVFMINAHTQKTNTTFLSPTHAGDISPTFLPHDLLVHARCRTFEFRSPTRAGYYFTKHPKTAGISSPTSIRRTNRETHSYNQRL